MSDVLHNRIFLLPVGLLFSMHWVGVCMPLKVLGGFLNKGLQ